MAWVLAAVVVGCLWATAAHARASTQVTVEATSGPSSDAGSSGLTDTGVTVQRSVSVSATGVIDIGYASDVPPDGDSGAGACSAICPAPTFTYWSLIARVGDGPWQEVGAGPTTIEGTGELYLAVDDDQYDDNSGQWTATVDPDPAQAEDSRLAIALDVQNGSVNSTSGSIDCGPGDSGPTGTNCVTTYAPGTPVTLSATPKPGYAFTGWVGGGCIGSGLCQVTGGTTNLVQATFAATSTSAPQLTLTNTDDRNGLETRGAMTTYTLTAGVSASSPSDESNPRLITLYDPLPAGETLAGAPSGTGWNCDESGGSEVRCTSSATSVAAGTTLPPVSVPVNVGPSAPSPLSNAAQIITSDAQAAVTATDVITAPSAGGGGTPPVAPSSGGARLLAPANVSPPVVTGTALPGDRLLCSPGTWTHSPTGYRYAWTRNGGLLAGATGSGYAVQVADEAQTLACRVMAVNAAGAGRAATSRGRLVAMRGTLGCPRPSGRLTGSAVGPLSLGQTRAQARRSRLPFARTRNGFDNFCLYGGWGIRVAYAPSALLRSLRRKPRRSVAGRVVIALTANPYFALGSIRAGMSFAAASRHRKIGKPLRVGRNSWYFVAGPAATGVLKVAGGIVLEVGVANKGLTSSLSRRRRFIRSFKNG